MKNVFTLNRWPVSMILAFFTLVLHTELKAQRLDNSPMESLKVHLLALNENGTTSLMDGNLTNYHAMFSNEVGNDDALKMTNSGENFGILRGGKRLAVEQRKCITQGDTTHFVMWNMQRRKYRIAITTDKLNHLHLKGFLEDVYTRTSLILNLHGMNQYDFAVNADPASYAQNRFRVVFIQSRKASLPVTINDVILTRSAKNVLLQWKVDNETDMDHYSVEYTEDGIHYNTIRTITPYNTNDGLLYSVSQPIDKQGEHSFRIRGHSNSGEVFYSKAASIRVDQELEGISVYPNPIVNRSARLQWSDMPAGKYQLFLISSHGIRISLPSIQYPGGKQAQQVNLPQQVQPGVYRLQLIGPDNKITVTTINVL